MKIDINLEVTVFFAVFIFGFCSAMAYDFFRTLRYNTSSKCIIGVWDLVFLTLFMSGGFLCISHFNSGQLRFFEFLALLLGFVFYATAFGFIFRKIFKKIIFIIKKLFYLISFPLKKSLNVVKKILIRISQQVKIAFNWFGGINNENKSKFKINFIKTKERKNNKSSC